MLAGPPAGLSREVAGLLLFNIFTLDPSVKAVSSCLLFLVPSQLEKTAGCTSLLTGGHM